MIRYWLTLWRVVCAARHARRHRRVHRAIRYVAHAAISKPAIVGYVCVVLPGGFWMGWPSAAGGVAGGQPSQFADIAPSLPIEYPSSLLSPSPQSGGASAIGRPITSAESRQAVAPSRGRHPIPEPASLTLLAGAVVAMGLWRVG